LAPILLLFLIYSILSQVVILHLMKQLAAKPSRAPITIINVPPASHPPVGRRPAADKPIVSSRFGMFTFGNRG